MVSSRPGAPEPELRHLAWTESDRLDPLERYQILDTGREPGFDDIADLAADILDAPIADDRSPHAWNDRHRSCACRLKHQPWRPRAPDL